MYYIDSDNAMGSRAGDVDDAFALSALLYSKTPILALGAVGGNTSPKRAFENNKKLLELFDRDLPVLRHWEVPKFFSHSIRSVRALALGPMTNIATLIHANPAAFEEIIMVGSNSSSKGRFPPLWPFEFNLVKDRKASFQIFQSGVPLTLLPLNVARRLQVSRDQVLQLQGSVGEYLQVGSKRWFRRAQILKGKKTVPLWDLAAAFYVIQPELFKMRKVTVRVRRNAWVEYGKGDREVNLIYDFSPEELWRAFERLFPDSG